MFKYLELYSVKKINLLLYNVVIVKKSLTTVGLFVILLTNMTAVQAVTNNRYALVIGNSNYKYATKLKNPKNDAIDLTETLRSLHFETTLIQNATNSKIKKSVIDFLSKLKETGGVGLFYYAGHGVQFEGSNYLVPVETRAGTEIEIKNQSFNISSLLNGMRNIKTATNIIILDACRDNPFKYANQPGIRSRSVTPNRSLVRVSIPKLDSGLSKLNAPSNTLIAFATAPGKVALDGKGRNSPYTSQLIASLQRSGLTIGEVFRQVRLSVVKESKGKQIPWESSSLLKNFYFKHRTLLPMGF